jgi:hypothetical protein
LINFISNLNEPFAAAVADGDEVMVATGGQIGDDVVDNVYTYDGRIWRMDQVIFVGTRLVKL